MELTSRERKIVAGLLHASRDDGVDGRRDTYRNAVHLAEDDEDLEVLYAYVVDKGEDAYLIDPNDPPFERLVALGLIEDDGSCTTCGGSGGGPDPETRCWSCKGKGTR